VWNKLMRYFRRLTHYEFEQYGMYTVMAISIDGLTGVTTPAVLGGALPQIADYVRGLAGTVRQVLSASTATEVYSAAGSTEVSTGLSVTITPASTSNKILILVMQNIAAYGSGELGGESGQASSRLVLKRGSTPLAGANITSRVDLNNYKQINVVFPVAYLDAPNTTSAITYSTVFTGGAHGAAVQAFGVDGSHIIVLEIVG
jgi:hypothetical protein